MDPSRPQSYSVSNRPVLSPDRKFLAVFEASATRELSIFSLKQGRPILRIGFHKKLWTFLSTISILRWSPESLEDVDLQQNANNSLTTWLLLAGGSRLIAIEVNIPSQPNSTTAIAPSLANILADYEFETQYGKIAVADFVLDHKQALVTFEMNTHASLVSLTKPQRDDIPSPKFSSIQGLAQSLQQRHFALLLRTNARDQIAVFTSRDGAAQEPYLFFPDTVDAQGLEWSPGGSPVLAVWDSAVHGVKILFFTALGHALPSLSLQAVAIQSNASLLDMQAIGVTCIRWIESDPSGTMLAAGIGGPHLVLREDNITSMKTLHTSVLSCGNVINGGESIVWQQQEDKSFERVDVAFEVQVEQLSEINMIAINSQADIVAARIDSMPRSVWLWHSNSHEVSCFLTFQPEIKRLLWHPTIPNILVIMTNERRPTIYILYNFQQVPAVVLLPFEDLVPSSTWDIDWIRSADTTRSPLLVSSTKQFMIGFLSLSTDAVVFESLLSHSSSDEVSEIDETEFIDTPSKSAPHKTSAGSLQLKEIDENWTLPVTQYTW